MRLRDRLRSCRAGPSSLIREQSVMTTSFHHKSVRLAALAVFLVLLPCGPAIAQTFQFLPEVDV